MRRDTKSEKPANWRAFGSWLSLTESWWIERKRSAPASIAATATAGFVVSIESGIFGSAAACGHLLGLSADPRLLVVCHCYRQGGDVIRIISARRADRKERGIYATSWSR